MDEVVQARVGGIALEEPLHEPHPRLVGVLLVGARDVEVDPLEPAALLDPPFDWPVEANVERRRMRPEHGGRASTQHDATARLGHPPQALRDASPQLRVRVEISGVGHGDAERDRSDG